MAGAAQAQVDLAVDAGVSNAYVWRGVTSTNRPVIQAEAMASAPVAGGSLQLGAWTNIEPRRYNGVGDISSVYGRLSSPAFTQYSAWLELSHDVAGATLVGGTTAYLYPAVADLASTYNTVEAYASLELPFPLAPKVAIYQDLVAVRGTYFEGSFSGDIALHGGHALSVGVLAAASLAQGPDANGRDATYFDRNGMTHLDFSLSTDLRIGGLSLTPEAHLIRGFDPETRITAPDANRAIKVWAGATLHWTHRLGVSH